MDEKGKRVGEIKTLELYVKPEEGAVYYVINSEEDRRSNIKL